MNWINILEIIGIILPPLSTLIMMVVGGLDFAKQGINILGRPPINKYLYYSGKLLVLPMWLMPIFQCLKVNLRLFDVPFSIITLSIIMWLLGFVIIFAGSSSLGQSIRMGAPEEKTRLITDGFYKICRNPMYLGLYFTIVASILYTFNPIIFAFGVFSIVVHHLIVLSEERWLQKTYGWEYTKYYAQVKRYLGRTIHFSMRTKKEYLAPCGMYCSVCSILAVHHHNDQKGKERFAKAFGMQAEQIACEGCNSEKPFSFCRSCSIRACALGKNLEGCHLCPDFPCRHFTNFPFEKSKKEMLESIPRWQKLGTERWVKEVENRFTCSNCGTITHRQAEQCYSCENKLQ